MPIHPEPYICEEYAMTVIDNINRVFAIEDAALREKAEKEGLSTYLLEIVSSSGELLLRAYTTASSVREAQARAPFAIVSKYRRLPMYRDGLVHYDI